MNLFQGALHPRISPGHYIQSILKNVMRGTEQQLCAHRGSASARRKVIWGLHESQTQTDTTDGVGDVREW